MSDSNNKPKTQCQLLDEQFQKLIQPSLDEVNSNLIKMERIGADYIDPRSLENRADYFVQLSGFSTVSLENLKSFKLPKKRSMYIAELEFTPSETASMVESDAVFSKNINSLLSDCWDSYFAAGIREFPFHKSCNTPGRNDEYFMKNPKTGNTVLRVYLSPAIEKESSNV